MKEIHKLTNIAELVAENYQFAEVFTRFKIDYCCNGNKTLETVCSEQDIDIDALLKALNDTLNTADHAEKVYQYMSPSNLVDYIEDNHHSFVTSKIEFILPILQKVVTVHGARHPELAQIQEEFVQSAKELVFHMEKEEKVLFPYIKLMEQKNTPNAPFGTVANPIKMMQHEHNEEGERFRRIEALTNNYTPPENACTTYQVLYAELKAFQADLHKHIHLENNVLFQKALKMERLEVV